MNRFLFHSLLVVLILAILAYAGVTLYGSIGTDGYIGNVSKFNIRAILSICGMIAVAGALLAATLAIVRQMRSHERAAHAVYQDFEVLANWLSEQSGILKSAEYRLRYIGEEQPQNVETALENARRILSELSRRLDIVSRLLSTSASSEDELDRVRLLLRAPLIFQFDAVHELIALPPLEPMRRNEMYTKFSELIATVRSFINSEEQRTAA